jgi:hypothetical protein
VIAATARELRDAAEASTDASGYFAAMYALVTERIAGSIDAQGFVDGARMDAFATVFAARYLRARADPSGRPRCWQASFDVVDDPHLLIVQHLLLGINAHVNHDLPLAVVDVARAGDGLAAVRADFDAVNDVLADAYDDVLERLDGVSRWSNEVARLGGGRLVNFSLRVARRQAWSAAERLYLIDDADDAERHRRELDRLVAVLAYLITRPPRLARPLLWVSRRLEEDDPATVTARLLAGT